jgi:hypothetical protein
VRTVAQRDGFKVVNAIKGLATRATR